MHGTFCLERRSSSYENTRCSRNNASKLQLCLSLWIEYTVRLQEVDDLEVGTDFTRVNENRRKLKARVEGLSTLGLHHQVRLSGQLAFAPDSIGLPLSSTTTSSSAVAETQYGSRTTPSWMTEAREH